MQSNLLPGDCFLIDVPNSLPHFFFIISKPDRFPADPVVLVPMTSVTPDKNIDPACTLAPGDHRCCVKASFIDYRRAVKLSAERLEELVYDGVARSRPPGATPDLLNRMRDGAEESEFLTGEMRDILYRQGLLRP